LMFARAGWSWEIRGPASSGKQPSSAESADVRSKRPIIGLCGGIGAGKSRVAKEFGRQGCLVIDHDRLNQEVLQLPEVMQVLREWWGEEVVPPGGPPDRRRIAEIVFADPGERRRLEGLVHPLIVQRQRTMIGEVDGHSTIKAIVIDSPLLFESNLDHECDTVVFVDASVSERRRRCQERGWDAKELRRRERWQISLTEKRARAEFVVDNEGPAERLCPQVAEILQQVLAAHSRTE
jgi:dephospho-CoA kinase